MPEVILWKDVPDCHLVSIYRSHIGNLMIQDTLRKKVVFHKRELWKGVAHLIQRVVVDKILRQNLPV
jgi:hypothetical protein